MKLHITNSINDSVETKLKLLEKATEIEQMCSIVVDCYRKNGKLVIFGNGGSAADAQHIAAELVGLLHQERDRPSIPAIALNVNTSVLTAIGNDRGYDEVFARQVECFAGPNDAVIGISTSGNSANIVKGLIAAKSMGAKAIGWTGESGGKMKDAGLDFLLKVPAKHCGRIQESHIMVGHIMCDLVEKELHYKDK